MSNCRGFRFVAIAATPPRLPLQASTSGPRVAALTVEVIAFEFDITGSARGRRAKVLICRSAAGGVMSREIEPLGPIGLTADPTLFQRLP
jgi:hypothetical protein